MFNKCLFKISFEDNEIEDIVISIEIDNLAHLIGLQYCYDKEMNKSKFSGDDGIETLKNNSLTIRMLKKNFNNNSKKGSVPKGISWSGHILPRIEWLPCFLNKIAKENMFLCFNEGIKTSLKGKYLLFKSAEGTYLILSLKKAGYYFKPETFICNNGLNYYNPEKRYEIKSIEVIS